MVWWSVAGFSVLRQTAQRTRCLCTLTGPAARNADVSISSMRRKFTPPLCSLQKYLSHHANRLGSNGVDIDHHLFFLPCHINS